MENVISAAENPALANKLAQDAMLLAQQEELVRPAKPVLTAPPSGQVDLAAGLFSPFDQELTMVAEVRELNGADEEAISKVGDAAKGLMTVLQRATVSIGDKKATPELLDQLLSGDRELLLLEIRKATFGNEVSLVGPCPMCEAPNQNFDIDLTKDVTVKKLDDPISDRNFTVKCKVGDVSVSLPNGKTQKKLVNAGDKTSAELDTILLKDCIASINEMPVVDIKQILNLSVTDRRKILMEIAERNPGPELSEIKKTCAACSQEVTIPLSLADLFRG